MAGRAIFNRYSRWVMAGLVFLAALILVFPQPAKADMGPKPQITIIVNHPPQGEYYLDLLVKGKGSYDNLGDEASAYDQAKLALLASYEVDGWHAGLARGTGTPMFGKLTGTRDGQVMIHRFSYVGVPDDFKIIIVTPDDRLIVSEETHRNTYQATLNYDYGTGLISQKPLALSYLQQFSTTCAATLVIEGLVLLLFGFSLKQNWRAFLAVNLATQAFLTITIGTAVLQQGAFTGLLVYLPAESVIMIAEAAAFSRLLKQHGKVRRVFYALTANILSFAMGLVLLWL